MKVPAPDYKNTVEVNNALNSDIISVLKKNFPLAVQQARKIAHNFEGANETETARNIWNYFRNYITYKKDAPGFQDIRLPFRFFTDKTGDCKSYAINSLALYNAIYPALDVAYKLTAYTQEKKELGIPSHVYGVVKDRNGKEIIIDGCWSFFNSEKDYTFVLPIQFMQVRTLSDNPGATAKKFDAYYDSLPRERQLELKQAIARKTKLELIKQLYNSGEMSKEDALKGIGEIEQEIEKKLTPEQKAARKKKRKKGLKKFGRGLAFISLAPVRGAFLSLVAMNLNGLASNMKLVKDMKDQSHWKKILKFWKNVGGLKKLLVKSMEAGTKHKPLWMSKKSKGKYAKKLEELKRKGLLKGTEEDLNGIDEADDIYSIGVAPAVAAAAIALGSTLLAGIIPIVMKAVKGHPKAEAAAEATGETVVEEAQAGQSYTQAFPDNEGVQPGQAPDPVQLDDIEPELAQEQEEVEQEDIVEYIGAVLFDNDNVSDCVSCWDGIQGFEDINIEDSTDLWSSLGKVAAVGTEFLGNVITKKAKKAKKKGGKGAKAATALTQVFKGGTDHFREQYAKQAKFTDVYQAAGKSFGVNPLLLLGVAGTGLLIFAFRK